MKSFKQFVAEESPIQALRNAVGSRLYRKEYEAALRIMKGGISAADASRRFQHVDARTLQRMYDMLNEATKEQELKFHQELDKLVHSTFGERPGEEQEDEEDEDEEEEEDMKESFDGRGSYSHRSFKRKEQEAEYKRDQEIERIKKQKASEPHHIYINNKVWKKDGKPVHFNNKAHANKAALSILKKDPNKNVKLVHHDYTTRNNGEIKQGNN